VTVEASSPDSSATGGGAAPPACSSCGAPLADGFAFCESCGAPTGATGSTASETPGFPASSMPAPAALPAADSTDGDSARTTLIAHPDDEPTQNVRIDAAAAAGAAAPSTCSCGGTFEDGWCTTCGAPQPDARDHVVVTVSPRLGCVSDRGVVHHRNEDAGTAVDLGGPVACIVADGVSNAEGSQTASAAAVVATGEALTGGATREASRGTDGSPPDWPAALRRSRAAAASAAASPEVRGKGEAPSCTWVAAVTDGTQVWTAWVGDSRTYLVGDDGNGLRVSTDHSWAAEAIAAGADHDEVMADRRAHMITAWLGVDAPELPDATAQVPVEGPGWLLVVSDGLWNYCDDADDLAALVARLGGPNLDATALAEALVGYATAAGGADNITVAAARLDGPTASVTHTPRPSAADTTPTPDLTTPGA
jgi:serine/threonine protein phosphatase PrpC